MKEVMGKFRKNNSGFSFIELLCAIAIFSVVTGMIATIVVVSTRTYRNGISETSVQQEVQLAANTIGDIIKDACTVVYYENGKKKLENGIEAETDETYSGNTKLTVVTNDNIQYDFIYNEKENAITYTKREGGSETGESELLAQNVSSFSVLTGSFQDSKSITVNMSVTDTNTKKTINSSYTMKSRNEQVGVVTYAEVSDDSPIIIFLEDEVCIVPGEEAYKIPLYVSNITSTEELGIAVTSTNGDEMLSSKITKDESGAFYAEVYLEKDKYNTCSSFYNVNVYSKEKKSVNGTYLSSDDCTVYIRTVKDISLTYEVNDKNATTNDSVASTMESKGAVYNISASVAGYNLNIFNDYINTFDMNYKIAQAVTWSYELTAGGKTFTFDSSKDSNAENDYIEVVKADTKEDVADPILSVKLKQDMPIDFELKVTATSKHSAGINKGNSHYADVQSNVLVIKKLEAIDEYIMEPNEEETYDISTSITSITGTVTYEYYIKDASGNLVEHKDKASDTTAKYDKETKKVTVHIGNEERGNGETYSDEPYTFYVVVKVGGTTIANLRIHVRRIDYVHVLLDDFDESNDVKKDDKGNVTGVTYRFKVRYNTTDVKQQDSILRYLIKSDMDDDYTNDNEDDIKKTLAVQFSWEIKDSTDSSNELKTTDTSYNLTDSKGKTNGQTFTLKAFVDYRSISDKYASKWENDGGKKLYDNDHGVKKDGTMEIKDKNGISKTETVQESGTFVLEGYKYKYTVKYPIVRVYHNEKYNVLEYSMIQAAEVDITLQDTSSGLSSFTTKCYSTTTTHPSNVAAPANLNSIATTSFLAKDKRVVVKATALHPMGTTSTGEYTNRTKGIKYSDEISDTYVLSQEELDYTVKADYVKDKKVIVEAGKKVTIPFSVNAGKLRNLNLYLSGLHYGTNTKIDHITVEDSRYPNVLNPYNTNNIYYNIKFERELYGLEWDDDFEIKCSVTIDIGDIETGKDDQGFIELNFAPYLIDGSSPKDNYLNDDGIQVVQIDLRKVLSVDVSVANGDIGELNKIDGTITLEAKPTGYGETGVECYPKSKFEIDTNDTYYSPYIMQWSLVEENGTVHEFGDDFSKNYLEVVTPSNTEGYQIGNGTYYKSGMYLYPADDDPESAGHKSVITIKLKKALPKGMRIRATSLHSLGKNSSGENTNKTGEQYSSNDSGVYGDVLVAEESINVNLIGLASTTMEVSKGQVVKVPVYISVADVSGISPSFENTNGTYITSITVEEEAVSNQWISIPTSIKNNNPNGIVKCEINIKVSDNQNTDFKLNLGICQKIDGGDQIVRTDTITFNVK